MKLSGELAKILYKRRSCRRFTEKKVTRNQMKAILRAAQMSPSSVNLQTWTFVVFSPKKWKHTFNTIIPFNGAFAVIICADLARPASVFEELRFHSSVTYTMAVFNAGIAAMAMTAASEGLGLGTVMLSDTGRTGILDYEMLSDTLNLPEGVFPITTLVGGYPAEKSWIAPPRLPIRAVTGFGRYPHYVQKVKNWAFKMRTGFYMSKKSKLADKLKYYKGRILAAEPKVAAGIDNFFKGA